jgi:hypothetical protein
MQDASQSLDDVLTREQLLLLPGSGMQPASSEAMAYVHIFRPGTEWHYVVTEANVTGREPVLFGLLSPSHVRERRCWKHYCVRELAALGCVVDTGFTPAQVGAFLATGCTGDYSVRTTILYC